MVDFRIVDKKQINALEKYPPAKELIAPRSFQNSSKSEETPIFTVLDERHNKIYMSEKERHNLVGKKFFETHFYRFKISERPQIVGRNPLRDILHSGQGVVSRQHFEIF